MCVQNTKMAKTLHHNRVYRQQHTLIRSSSSSTIIITRRENVVIANIKARTLKRTRIVFACILRRDHECAHEKFNYYSVSESGHFRCAYFLYVKILCVSRRKAIVFFFTLLFSFIFSRHSYQSICL